MTREEAIAHGKEQLEVFGGEHREFIEMAIKALEQESRWIPGSERLPEVADCYAVTRKIGSDLITSACYFDGIDTWYNDNQINQERNPLTNIIAWMPLPKAYREVEV